VLLQGESGAVLWTWAGLRANETLLAAVGPVGEVSADNTAVRLPPGVGVAAIRAANVATALPLVSPEAVEGLKFSAALPLEMATATLAERFVDRPGAADVVGSRIVVGRKCPPPTGSARGVLAPASGQRL
jgi:ATP-dependent Lhr-like helicase